MIVFAETNFVLEIALKQETASAASEILELAETKKVDLVMPAFSLVEPYHKLERLRRERRDLLALLEAQVGQMARSAEFADLRAQSNRLFTALAQKSDIDANELESTIARIHACAAVVPLTKEIITAASARQLVDLKPHDALVFASIVDFLTSSRPSESLLANKDAKDFLEATVSGDLQKRGCKVIPSFPHALEYLQKRFSKPSEKRDNT